MASLAMMTSAFGVLEYCSIGKRPWKFPLGVAKSLRLGFVAYPGYFTVDNCWRLAWKKKN
jgi:hypothetical protein